MPPGYPSSGDARAWEKLSEVNIPGEDIRDPKFAVIGGRLFLYVLKSTRFIAEPYRPALRTSADGRTWTPLVDIDPEGWLFWRQKTRDGRTWYVPPTGTSTANPSCLNRPTASAGRRYSVIHEGDWNDETDSSSSRTGA